MAFNEIKWILRVTRVDYFKTWAPVQDDEIYCSNGVCKLSQETPVLIFHERDPLPSEHFSGAKGAR